MRHNAFSSGSAFLLGLLALVAGLGSSCTAKPSRAKAASGRPSASRPAHGHGRSVILITFDTLRADVLGCYGDRTTRTPTFDRLAAEGVFFENAFTAHPFTAPALWSLLHSEPVHAYTYGTSLNATRGRSLSLAKQFRRAGYLTAAVVGSSVLNPGSGFERGFDHYHATYAERAFGNETTLARTLELVRDVLEPRPAGQPFFLYVHFFDPHSPWADAPASFRVYPPVDDAFAKHARLQRAFYINLEVLQAVSTYSGKHALSLRESGDYESYVRPMYRSEVSWSDDVLGRLLGELRKAGLLEDALFAVSADHGIAFAEHYQTSGYVFSLFNEALHVPLILSAPGLAARHVAAPVSLVDLGPTLLDLAGVASQEAERRSLRPLARGGGRAEDVYAEATAMEPDQLVAIDGDDEQRYGLGPENSHAALIRGRLKIIHMPHRRGAKFELFDLAADPREKHDLYDAAKPLHRELADALLRRRGALAPNAATIDPDALERLRALGYVK